MLRCKLTLTANLCMRNFPSLFFFLFSLVFWDVWEMLSLVSVSCVTVSVNGLQCLSMCQSRSPIIEPFRFFTIVLLLSLLCAIFSLCCRPSAPKHWTVAKPRFERCQSVGRSLPGASRGPPAVVFLSLGPSPPPSLPLQQTSWVVLPPGAKLIESWLPLKNPGSVLLKGSLKYLHFHHGAKQDCRHALLQTWKTLSVIVSSKQESFAQLSKSFP